MIREDMPTVELGVVAATLDPSVESIRFAPTAVSVSGPRHLLPGIHFWRLFSLFENADDPSYAVIGGHVDVVTVELDEADVADCLYTSLKELAFDDAQIDAVTNLVDDPERLTATAKLAGTDTEPERLLLVLDIFIDQTLRGRDLGLVLLAEAYEFFDDDAQTTLVVAPTTEETPPALTAYWQQHFAAARDRQGILILPNVCTPPSSTDILATSERAGYINVDVAALRSRLQNHDDTLFAASDGRTSTATDTAAAVADQAAAASEIVLEATEYDESIDSSIAAVLRFAGHPGTDNSGYAEVFAEATEYLETHPDVSIIATNWRTEPCPMGGGTDLILEIIVRLSE